jgi:2-hydroxychromene-2-carboxylate isomerase
MKTLEVFYDLSSPWTYLAFNNIQPIIAEAEVVVRWRPFLVGGVFNAVNQDVYAARAEPMAPKIVHNYRWLHEWARLAQLPLVFPTEHHPVKSVLAMRCCCALEEDPEALLGFSLAAFRSYFAYGDNIDDPAVLIDTRRRRFGASFIAASQRSVARQYRGSDFARRLWLSHYFNRRQVIFW